MPNQALQSTVMDAANRKKTDSPDIKKQREQHAIQSRTIFDQGGLEIPAATLGILKGGFHAHAPGIVRHLLMAGCLIRNQEPGFLVTWLPDGTEVGLQAVVLPHLHRSKPALPFLFDQQSTCQP